MRVVFTTTGSPWDSRAGVAPQTALALAEAMHRRGIDTTLVCTTEHQIPPVEECGFPVIWASLLQPVVKGAALSPHAAPIAWALRDLNAAAPIDIVHGQGEEMVLVCDAVPRALRVLTAHPLPRPVSHRTRTADARPPCGASARLALELAHAVVVSGPNEMRASAAVELLAWDSVVAMERGLARRFFAEASRYASGPATHLLFAGGTGDDPRAALLERAMDSSGHDALLPVCWIPGVSGAPRRAAAATKLPAFTAVERIRAPEDRELQRLVGRAAEILILDASDAAAMVLRVALAMGRRPVVAPEALRSLVISLDGLGLAVMPETVDAMREQLRAASARGVPPAPDASVRDFARAHFAWDAVAARYAELYERLSATGSARAIGVPESETPVSKP